MGARQPTRLHDITYVLGGECRISDHTKWRNVTPERFRVLYLARAKVVRRHCWILFTSEDGDCHKDKLEPRVAICTVPCIRIESPGIPGVLKGVGKYQVDYLRFEKRDQKFESGQNFEKSPAGHVCLGYYAECFTSRLHFEGHQLPWNARINVSLRWIHWRTDGYLSVGLIILIVYVNRIVFKFSSSSIWCSGCPRILLVRGVLIPAFSSKTVDIPAGTCAPIRPPASSCRHPFECRVHFSVKRK